MLKDNETIVLSGIEALEILREIEFILISLHKMGSYYSFKPDSFIEYAIETTKFIDNEKVTERLAVVRKIICEKFNSELGEDDMDDIERSLDDLIFWKPPIK